jgi:hypothetical protein
MGEAIRRNILLLDAENTYVHHFGSEDHTGKTLTVDGKDNRAIISP